MGNLWEASAIMSNPISSLSSGFLREEMPLWKAAYIGVNQDHEKMLGQSQVCKKQSCFQAVLWVTNSSSERGWGTLAQRTPAASDRSQHWNHMVRAEERAEFSSRQTQHAKSHVGWHN